MKIKLIFLTILSFAAGSLIDHFVVQRYQEQTLLENQKQEAAEKLEQRRFEAVKNKKYNLYMTESGVPPNTFYDIRLCWWDKLNEDGSLTSGQDEPIYRIVEKSKHD